MVVDRVESFRSDGNGRIVYASVPIASGLAAAAPADIPSATAAQLASAEMAVLESVWDGDHLHIRVRLRNNGQTVWPAPQSRSTPKIALVLGVASGGDAGEACTLCQDLSPGENLIVDCRFRAPEVDKRDCQLHLILYDGLWPEGESKDGDQAKTGSPFVAAEPLSKQASEDFDSSEIDAEFMSKYADFEETFRGETDLIRSRLEVYLPLVLKVEPSSTGERRGVDLGAGRGEWVQLLLDNGWNASGVDTNEGMVSAAAKRGIVITNVDILDYLRSLKADSCSLVSAFHVVEHLSINVLVEVLSEIGRVLQPGGLVILETPNPENLSVASWSFRMDPSHDHPVPPLLLQHLSARAGLCGATVVRLNGSSPTGVGTMVAGLAALFHTALDYALLATKGSEETSRRIMVDIDSFEKQRSEKAPLPQMIEHLQKVDAELSSLAETSVQMAKAFDQLEADACTRMAKASARFEAEQRAHAAQLLAYQEQLSALLTSTSWRITGVLRTAMQSGRWLFQGGSAWLSFRSGSRPHRTVTQIFVWLYGKRAAHSVLPRAIRRIISYFPQIERKAQNIAYRNVGDIANRPAWGKRLQSSLTDLEPESVQVAFARLSAAAASAGSEIPPTKRPRLAYVSPIPPARTGIADYSADLLPALASHYDITLVVEDTRRSVSFGGIEFLIRGIDWFHQNAGGFNRIVYQFGNSRAHAYMIELIADYPGVVVMHDVYTGDLFASLEISSGWEHFYSQEIVASHGFKALRERLTGSDLLDVILAYPANLRLVRAAEGILVHSRYARDVLRGSFSEKQPCRIIPQVRVSAELPNRDAARRVLGISTDAFVVCSMGAIYGHKALHRIIEAWRIARYHEDPRARLFLVGDAPASEYTTNLRNSIAAFGASPNVVITGHVSEAEYNAFIAAADCLVQLRTQTRGETSRAVLDGMSAGRTVIINEQGAMAELSDDAVLKLDEKFEDNDLAAMLGRARDRPAMRDIIGGRAREVVLAEHAPAIAAEAMRAAMEGFAETSPTVFNMPRLRAAAVGIAGADDPAARLLQLARDIAPEYVDRRPCRQLLIDVSVVARDDIRTGIQRVVRAQLVGLLESPPPGWRVEPVILSNRGGKWIYEYARNFAASLFDISGIDFPRETVDVGEGDALYIADYATDWLIAASEQGLYKSWRAAGVAIGVAVYDILPLSLPEYFPSYARDNHAKWLAHVADFSDKLICISAATAQSTTDWLEHQQLRRSSLEIVGIPLGADISASVPTRGVPASAGEVINRIRARPTFIMVGTIEPRKGHLQAIAAFEKIWDLGIEAQLLIVGGEGWKGVPADERRTIPDILKAIRSCRERGRRLFWLDGVSDEYLDELYRASSCLLAPSEGEGFGLPLVEAARHGLPILARDLPVFREIAGQSASYFSGLSAHDITDAVQEWLLSREKDLVLGSHGMRWLTWAENVRTLSAELTTMAQGCGEYGAPRTQNWYESKTIQ